MKLKELIQRVDRSERNTDDAEVEDFASMFNIQMSWEHKFGERVKKHWIYNWMCTDTWVGLAAYYMDGEPVAVSFQSARKSDENIEFVSKEAGYKVRDFIVSLMEPEEAPSFSVADLEEDVGPGYTVSYGEQLLRREAKYQDQDVKVVHTYDTHENHEMWRKVDIQLPDGDIRTVPLSDLCFPFYLMPAEDPPAVVESSPSM